MWHIHLRAQLLKKGTSVPLPRLHSYIGYDMPLLLPVTFQVVGVRSLQEVAYLLITHLHGSARVL